MCSGFHVASLLLARHAGWTLADYWRPEHPDAAGCPRRWSGGSSASSTEHLIAATDNCGVQTYAFPMAAIARAFALLADPEAGADASRVSPRAASDARPRRHGRVRPRWSAGHAGRATPA